MTSPDRASKQTAETDDITDDIIRADTTRAAWGTEPSDDEARTETPPGKQARPRS